MLCNPPILTGDLSKALSSLLRELQLQLLWAPPRKPTPGDSLPCAGPVSLVFSDQARAHLIQLEDLHRSFLASQQAAISGPAAMAVASAALGSGAAQVIKALTWLDHNPKPPAADSSCCFAWLQTLMQCQAQCLQEGRAAWLALALAPCAYQASKARCDSLRQQQFHASRREKRSAGSAEAADCITDASGAEALSALIKASSQHLEVYASNSLLYADLVQALKAVSNTGTMPSETSRGGRHSVLAAASMEVLGCESHPDAPHKVLLQGWVPKAADLLCATPGGPDGQATSASLRGFSGAASRWVGWRIAPRDGKKWLAEVLNDTVGWAGPLGESLSPPPPSPIHAHRLWQHELDEMDCSLALDACKGAVHFLPSVSSFLHEKHAGSMATHHQALPNAGGDSGCGAATLHTVCETLSQGLSACERQLSRVTGPMIRQSMSDAQLVLQERLHCALASPQLPQAFDPQLFSATCSPGLVLPRCFNWLCQLVAVRADPVAQAPLAALAERISTSRTIPADVVSRTTAAGSKQLMFHSHLGYESIGRICVLQVCG